MDKQSQQILERVLSEKNNNPTNKNQKVPLLGGLWNENSEFFIFKNMCNSLVGKWGELMFEKSFGYKSENKGLDLPSLNADIKTFTRQLGRNKFGGRASEQHNPDWYFIYLIFPNEYQLYRVPSDDPCIRHPAANKLEGHIDITHTSIARFISKNYMYGNINDTTVNLNNGTLGDFF